MAVALHHLRAQKRDAFRYRSGTEGKIIEVDLYYTTGFNLASRGIWFGLRPLEVGNGFEISPMLGGVSIMLAPAERFKMTTLRGWVERIDPIIPELVTIWQETGDPNAIRNRIAGLFGLAGVVG